PLPRLRDARLESAGDLEPNLGRTAARPEVVGGAAGARRPGRARDRGGALAGPRRRRSALRPAQGVRRAARARALRTRIGSTMTEARAQQSSPKTPFVGLVPYG